jgi:hypothetical protein
MDTQLSRYNVFREHATFDAHPPANAGFGRTGRTCSMERKSSAGYAHLGLRFAPPRARCARGSAHLARH